MIYFPLIGWVALFLPQLEELKIIEQDHAKIENIMILGDSHTVGDFGEQLHRKLYDFKKFNVVSLGIGGAGSYHFTVTMRSFCCGAILRETCKYDSIPKNKPIPVTEIHYGASNGILGKFFKGKLSNFVKHYNPDLVIVALGSNYTNAHEELMQILRKDNINREIVWVGPMRRSNIEMRLYAIHQVIKKYPDIRFVSSEDVIGHDTITTAHYSGKSAQYWAGKIVDRMRFVLED